MSLEEIKTVFRSEDPVMIYNGNGAFSHHYSTLDQVAELSHNFTTSIVLPSTFQVAVDRKFFRLIVTFLFEIYSKVQLPCQIVFFAMTWLFS